MGDNLRHLSMRDKSAITLSDPARRKAIASIKRFFVEQMDDEIGFPQEFPSLNTPKRPA